MDREFYTGTDERGRPKDADRQARRVLRLEPCERHGTFHRDRARAGRAPRAEALRRLLGQGLRPAMSTTSCSRRSRSRPRAWRRCSPATSISSRRCRRPISTRIESDACCTLVTMPSPRILTFELNQDRVPAFKDPRVRLAINYAVNREGIADKIMRGLRHGRGPAQSCRLCRPRSGARAALRSRQGQGADEGGRLRGRLLGDDDGAEQPLYRGRARRRGGRRHARQDQHQGRSADHAQGAILAALRRARRPTS